MQRDDGEIAPADLEAVASAVEDVDKVVSVTPTARSRRTERSRRST